MQRKTMTPGAALENEPRAARLRLRTTRTVETDASQQRHHSNNTTNEAPRGNIPPIPATRHNQSVGLGSARLARRNPWTPEPPMPRTLAARLMGASGLIATCIPDVTDGAMARELSSIALRLRHIAERQVAA